MKVRRFLKIYDIAVIIIAGCTILTMLIYPYLFHIELRVNAKNGFTYTVLDDRETKNGASVASLLEQDIPGFICNLIAGYAYPFAALKITPDQDVFKQGIDLSKYESVIVDYRFLGDEEETLRIYIRNARDNVDGQQELYTTSKVNVAEFKPSRYPSPITIPLSSFHVPKWWRLEYDLSLGESQTEFDRVVGIEILTGTQATLGKKQLELVGLTFTGRSVSKALFYQGLVVLLIILGSIALLIRFLLLYHEHKKTILTIEDLKAHSPRDPLTGLYNQRAVENLSDKVHQNWERNSSSYSLMLCDLDDFWAINETLGHEAADMVLQKVSTIIAENCRKVDIVSRWGGEKFAILLPETALTESAIVADHILQSLQKFQWAANMHVTASIGIATIKQGESLGSLFNRADLALYKSKEGGKNQVTTFE